MYALKINQAIPAVPCVTLPRCDYQNTNNHYQVFHLVMPTEKHSPIRMITSMGATLNCIAFGLHAIRND